MLYSARMQEAPNSSPDLTEAVRLRWTLGAVDLDEARMELRRAGQVVDIEPKPLELLMFLLRHAGEVVTRQ